MKIVKSLLVISIVGLLSACSAKSLDRGAEKVELTTKHPDSSKCQYLGEVVGSQGNWITGDYTSNKDLIMGARNDMRNEAFALGANLVYVENTENTNAWGSLGTTNSTVVGKAYYCL